MYTWFYGFSEEPFNVNPDPGFFYPTETHRRVLDFMIRGIQERKGILLVLGELGSGKTTLIQYLLNTMDKKVKAAAVYRTPPTVEEFLEDVLRELGAPSGPQEKTSLVKQLNDYLHRLSPEETLALIIDDAHDLSPQILEELRLLPNPENLSAGKFQMVLAGQPELENKLASTSLREFNQKIEVVGEIAPLTEEERRLYIAHRLEKVDSEISRVFTAEAVDLICRHSRGNPRTLNILCDNVFLVGYGLSKKKIDSAIVTEVLEDLEFLDPEEPGPLTPEKMHGATAWAAGGKGKVLRKMAYSLLALAGVGAIILAGRVYLKGPEESLTAKFPIQPPGVQERGSFPPAEAKPEPLVKAEPRPDAAEPISSPGAPSKGAIGPPAKEPAPASSPQPPPKPGPPLAVSKPEPPPSASLPADLPRKAEGPTKKTVTVKAGESIYTIAARNYGIANTSVADKILEANPLIAGPDKIRANERVSLPDITEDSLVIEGAGGIYQIRLGTFLKPEYASFLRGEPVLRGREIRIFPRKLPGGETWHRAVAGKFNTREEGLKAIRELKNKGLSPYFPGFRKKR